MAERFAAAVMTAGDERLVRAELTGLGYPNGARRAAPAGTTWTRPAPEPAAILPERGFGLAC